MDVGEWLKGIGLGQYEATFFAHDIDVDVLPDLTEADLEKIGLPLGARKRLMKAIANLRLAESRPPPGALGTAHGIVAKDLVTHERADETKVYPRLRRSLASGYGLAAMSRVHRELLHLAHLLSGMSEGLSEGDIDAIAVRDGQRIIESIETIARIHNAQEEDIYEHAAAG